jgi:aryl-alcohol dehydrogenase-like predicted oxidoreductase
MDMIPTHEFGRTGHMSSRTIFGAAAFWNVTQDEADRTLELLLRYGVNHIDVAASYGDAELRIGPWMDRHRDQFFLATKTGERSYEGAREEIHRSLDRLRVDHVDLLQLHNLVDSGDWDQALSPGGALDAALEAREQGLVRFIGVTGHGTQIAAMHLRSLDRFDFDSVLLPYSWIVMQNPYYAENFDQVLGACQERNTAVQTIKSIARSPWLGRPHTVSTWYEPLNTQPEIDLAVHWVLGQPDVFLNTASSTDILPMQLDAASRLDDAMPREDLERLLERLDLVPLFV